MAIESILDVLSAFASTATAGVALAAYFRFLWDRRVKRLRLEAFLKPEIQHDVKFGPLQKACPVIAVMAALKMTEDEVIVQRFAVPSSNARVRLQSSRSRPYYTSNIGKKLAGSVS